MNSFQRCRCYASAIGFCLASASGAYAQVSSINSACIDARVFDDVPSATLTTVDNYPSTVSFAEQNVSSTNGYANRDVWYFSNNGGSSAYQFQNNDYFKASFNLTLTGGSTGYDLEAGFLVSNPSGKFGGDLQSLVTAAGVVVQFGGPSYYPFSPAAGGYPGPGGSVPNYVAGETYTLGLNYVIDPNTSKNAFEYSVNGAFAASSPGDPYFDLAPGQAVGRRGAMLGGYLQIQTDPNNLSNGGTALFGDISIISVPEPSTLTFLGLGIVTLGAVVPRRRRI